MSALALHYWPGEEVEPLALGEARRGIVLADAAEALEEVALLRPVLHDRGGLLGALVVERGARYGEGPVGDVLGRLVERLEHHEDVAQRPAVEPADDDRRDGACLGGRQGCLELV